MTTVVLAFALIVLGAALALACVPKFRADKQQREYVADIKDACALARKEGR